jgi:capsular exopolysaccharide synthesis family protein
MDRKGAKTLLVTSVAENEGKSTIASNIAISIAQEGKNVLLIDADFRKPSLYKIFDIDKNQVTNLVAILRSGVGMQKSIVKLKKYPLYFILNNTNTGSIDDVLANNRFRSLIRFSRTKFDYIILDTAPMGLVPDAEGIAELCDASLIVVREDVILAKNINDASDTLNETNAKVLGIVFNDAKLRGVSAIRTNSAYNYNKK